MTLDRTVAFTALDELDPSFRRLSLEQMTERISELLAAWYRQDEIPNLWDFTAHRLSTSDPFPHGRES
jgi:hypothetical protein